MRPGTLVGGKYRLSRFLGEGAMGSVWAAVHIANDQNVAVKLISGPETLAEELRSRLLREARACGRIQHPNVVRIYDVGTANDGSPFLVMQLLTGETLDARLGRDRRLPQATAARFGLEIARALAAAHRVGVVHRDLKPANVFLHTDPGEVIPTVKVLDFGVSKVLAERDARATATGHAVGSPAYMSPEQAKSANKVDARSDVWALGVLLFEMLSGTLPFPGETAYAVIGEVLHGPIPNLRDRVPDLDPRLGSLVSRCIVRDVNARVRSAEDVAAELEAFLQAPAPGRTAPAPQPSAPTTRADAPRVMEEEKTEPLGNNRLRAAVLGSMQLRGSTQGILDEPSSQSSEPLAPSAPGSMRGLAASPLGRASSPGFDPPPQKAPAAGPPPSPPPPPPANSLTTREPQRALTVPMPAQSNAVPGARATPPESVPARSEPAPRSLPNDGAQRAARNDGGEAPPYPGAQSRPQGQAVGGLTEPLSEVAARVRAQGPAWLDMNTQTGRPTISPVAMRASDASARTRRVGIVAIITVAAIGATIALWLALRPSAPVAPPAPASDGTHAPSSAISASAAPAPTPTPTISAPGATTSAAPTAAPTDTASATPSGKTPGKGKLPRPPTTSLFPTNPG